VSFIINSFNGSTVLVTADHGFIYQEAPLLAADKSALETQPEGTLKAKKRYLLGRGIGTSPKAWCGNTALTAGTDPEASLDFWVPKGASRFHFAGGARFVHGSAMPQEIVVPVITVRESESDKEKARYVEFSLLGASNKVVTNKQRFEFIQTEAVSDGCCRVGGGLAARWRTADQRRADAHLRQRLRSCSTSASARCS
jgi:hypothetical protein